MACTIPTTSSPGSLVLFYQNTDNTTIHTISWHFIDGVDLNNIAVLQVEADRLAGLLKPCMTSRRALIDWGIRLPGGATFYRAPLTTGAGNGSHAVASGMQNWYSLTIAFEGKGDAPAAGVCAGRIVSRLHLGGAIDFVPGMKYFDASFDAALTAFIATGLNASTYLPADYWGQQGDVGNTLPVQWNAHTQRKEGS